MYGEKKILALIPARGGSKGIPHKNILPLAGKPLISYTIGAGLQSKYIDTVLVSTDDPEIARVSKECGAEVPFLRPAELAADTSKTIDAVLHAVRAMAERGMTYDALVLLQPTSPLRTAEDTDRAIEKFYRCGRRAVVSVCGADDPPILMRTIEQGPDGERLKPLLNVSSTCRRQDMPAYYRVNGSIYINAAEELDETTSFNDNPVPYVMAKNHSVDIDGPEDLALAGFLLGLSV